MCGSSKQKSKNETKLEWPNNKSVLLWYGTLVYIEHVSDRISYHTHTSPPISLLWTLISQTQFFFNEFMFRKYRWFCREKRKKYSGRLWVNFERILEFFYWQKVSGFRFMRSIFLSDNNTFHRQPLAPTLRIMCTPIGSRKRHCIQHTQSKSVSSTHCEKENKWQN